MTRNLNSHYSLNSPQDSEEIPAWLATARAYKQRERSEKSETTTLEPKASNVLGTKPQRERSEKSELIPFEMVADLRHWLIVGTIARAHPLGNPLLIRPGEWIIDGPQFVRRCLVRIDAGEPGPNTWRRLETYHARLRVRIEEGGTV